MLITVMAVTISEGVLVLWQNGDNRWVGEHIFFGVFSSPPKKNVLRNENFTNFVFDEHSVTACFST